MHIDGERAGEQQESEHAVHQQRRKADVREQPHHARTNPGVWPKPIDSEDGHGAHQPTDKHRHRRRQPRKTVVQISDGRRDGEQHRGRLEKTHPINSTSTKDTNK